MEIHSVGPFILEKTLGKGSTGKVKLARHKETGFQVAVKIINKDLLGLKPTMRRKIEREISILKLLNHSSVLCLYDVYETSKYLFLVMEYVRGGELFDYLVEKGALSVPEAHSFFRQVVLGVKYIHSHFVAHRDLKPENILLDENRHIKIADLGMAAVMPAGKLLETSCGSPHYAAPEVIMGKKYDGFRSDVWSMGIILYALLTGRLPFDDDNIRRLLSKIRAGVFSLPSSLSPEARDLITRMLRVNPQKRLTVDEVIEHEWFRGAFLGVPPASARLFDAVVPPEFRNAGAVAPGECDEQVVLSMAALGWPDRGELMQALQQSEPNVEKMFYRLLDARRRDAGRTMERVMREAQGDVDMDVDDAASHAPAHADDDGALTLDERERLRRGVRIPGQQPSVLHTAFGTPPMSPMVSGSLGASLSPTPPSSAFLIPHQGSHSSSYTGPSSLPPSSPYSSSYTTPSTLSPPAAVPISDARLPRRGPPPSPSAASDAALSSSPVIGSTPRHSWFTDVFTSMRGGVVSGLGAVGVVGGGGAAQREIAQTPASVAASSPQGDMVIRGRSLLQILSTFNRALQTLGCTFSSSGNRITALHAERGVRFVVEITVGGEPNTHSIMFRHQQGDPAAFQQIVDSLQPMINI